MQPPAVSNCLQPSRGELRVCNCKCRDAYRIGPIPERYCARIPSPRWRTSVSEPKLTWTFTRGKERRWEWFNARAAIRQKSVPLLPCESVDTLSRYSVALAIARREVIEILSEPDRQMVSTTRTCWFTRCWRQFCWAMIAEVEDAALPEGALEYTNATPLFAKLNAFRRCTNLFSPRGLKSSAPGGGAG